MPPGFEPFLAAVCAAPWDDHPRLVFADWLDEQGWRARAEFIRMQCSLGPSARRDDPRRQRADALSRQHMAGWRADLPRLNGVGWGRFVRGFVEQVTLVGHAGVCSLGPTLLAAAPVRSLAVQDPPVDGFRLVAGCRTDNRATRLRVECGWWHLPSAVDDAGVETLANNPVWAGLASLAVDGRVWTGDWRTPAAPGLSDRAAAALLGSPHLGRLRTVRLRGIALTAAVRAELDQRFGRGLTVIP